MNLLIEQLADVCRQQRLEEKWLLAPSMRVGYQWLGRVAASGQPAVNVRVKTLKSMALDLAGPAMVEAGVELASDRAGGILLDRIFRRLGAERLRYLGQLRASAGLAETIHRSIQALRLAGLEAEQIEPRRFEVAAKGREVLLILREYLEELKAHRLIDYADVLRLAVARLAEDPPALRDDVRVLEPSDVRTTVLERRLLDRLPAGTRLTLPVDELGSPPERRPAGEIDIFHALGEVNEVREVFRRALSEGLRLDEIELLCADTETYVPLVYETLASLIDDQQAAEGDLPLTMAEGLPCRYSRPGRLLAGWVAWVTEGFPQDRLVKMVREGLLVAPPSDALRPEASDQRTETTEAANDGPPADEARQLGMPRVAAVLRGLGIGAGRDRYLARLDVAIAAARRGRQRGEDEDAELPADCGQQLESLLWLRALAAELLDISPDPEAEPRDALHAAHRLLDRLARRLNKTDNYARDALLKEIDDLARWAAGDEPLSLDAWQWLAALPGQTHILGAGPRPGCLHVAAIHAGGHSGRPRTFLLGLDDARLPGAGSQDPLLLDAERRAIDRSLPTAATQLDERVVGFWRLLARLRGRVTLGFSSHDLVDDRPRFPSSMLVTAYRTISGNSDATQQDLLAALDKPASFSPRAPEHAVSPAEWWLWRLCAVPASPGDEELVLAEFPSLAQGRLSMQRRASDAFTEYDGRVPEAGRDLDPTAEHGPVMSTSKLECAGRCALAYFFRCGLGIHKPDELELDPSRWLDPPTAGSLLHSVFERFFRARLERGESPCAAAHWPELQSILNAAIDDYRQHYPPPNEAVFQAQCRQLGRSAWIMLAEEEVHCRRTGSRPVYLEACLGLAPGAGTPLDRSEPIPVVLDAGRTLRACGKVDRIDRLPGDEYAIWDYKTGSSWRYRPGDPFCEGRVVQPALYLAMVRRRLDEIEPGAKVRQFGFFFPSQRERGRRIQWTAEQLADGRRVLGALAGTIAAGAFLPTSEAADCKYCEYLPICGDPQRVAQASKAKLAAGDPLLSDIASLRGDDQA